MGLSLDSGDDDQFMATKCSQISKVEPQCARFGRSSEERKRCPIAVGSERSRDRRPHLDISREGTWFAIILAVNIQSRQREFLLH